MGEIKQQTYNGDERTLTLMIVPRIGSVRLLDLKRDHIVRLAVDLHENGRARGRGAALAPQTVKSAIKTLRKVLNAAIDDELIARDPSRGVRIQTPPADVEHDFDSLKTWTASELGWLIGELDGMDRQTIGLTAATGIRRSEMCGLRWANVDLDAGVIRIRSTVTMEGNLPVFANTVKSKASRRAIAIDPAVVALLRQRRADQNRERLAAGTAWHDPHGLEPIGAHGLRHKFATISLANGVPLKTVSDALGHADIGGTADVYSHVTEDVAREAASIVGATIFSGAS